MGIPDRGKLERAVVQLRYIALTQSSCQQTTIAMVPGLTSIYVCSSDTRKPVFDGFAYKNYGMVSSKRSLMPRQTKSMNLELESYFGALNQESGIVSISLPEETFGGLSIAPISDTLRYCSGGGIPLLFCICQQPINA